MVVDASVAAKWLFLEAGTMEAIKILDSHERFIVPVLFGIEIEAIITKKLRRREITTAEAIEKKAQVRRLPLEVIPYHLISDTAFDLSISLPVTLYDATYIATAILQNCTFVTADERLVKGCSSTPLKATVQSIYA